MAKMLAVLPFLLILGMVSSDFLHKTDKMFRFTKAKDGSNEFEFEYDLSDGEIYRGKTFVLGDRAKHLKVMIGEDQTVYYVEVTCNEIRNENNFSTVRIAEKTVEGIVFMDNDNIYKLDIVTGTMSIEPYATRWNFHNVCLTKAETTNQTFHYKLLSKNNLREHYNQTYRETNDPHIQRYYFNDSSGGCVEIAEYEIHFTEMELQSNETFCRDDAHLLGMRGWCGPLREESQINPDLQEALVKISPTLVKSLVG